MPGELHWFENDGGPLLVAPRQPAPLWEGGMTPSRGRVAQATFRADGAVATDYDRACDVDDWARLLQAGDGWVLVLGGAVARAAWVPGPDADAFALVSVEWLPDTNPAVIHALLNRPPASAWRTVAEQLPVGPGGLLLMHAAGKIGEEQERQHHGAGPSFIGHAIAFPAPPGAYRIEVCDVMERQTDGVTGSAGLLRFTRRPGASRPERDDLDDDLNTHQVPLMPYEGCDGSSIAEELDPSNEQRSVEFEEFHRLHVEFVRARNPRGSEALCRSYLAKADRSNDAEAAAGYAGFLATILSFQHRHDEALEAHQVAERYLPRDPHRKIKVASFLIHDLRRPADGLAKLAEAEPLLDAEGALWKPGFWRSSWLNEQGLGLLASGRLAEAAGCFRELARPERLAVMRRATSLRCVDLRLVARLVALGLARDECAAYLDVAEAIGVTAEPSDPSESTYLKTVRRLRARVRGV